MVCNNIVQVQMYSRVHGPQPSSLMERSRKLLQPDRQESQELGFGFTWAMVAEVITDYLVST